MPDVFGPLLERGAVRESNHPMSRVVVDDASVVEPGQMRVMEGSSDGVSCRLVIRIAAGGGVLADGVDGGVSVGGLPIHSEQMIEQIAPKGAERMSRSVFSWVVTLGSRAVGTPFPLFFLLPPPPESGPSIAGALTIDTLKKTLVVYKKPQRSSCRRYSEEDNLASEKRTLTTSQRRCDPIQLHGGDGVPRRGRA